MRLILGVAGTLLLLVALAVTALMIVAVAAGEPLVQPMGALWFAVDPGSLNMLQVVIERYLWAPIWEYAVLPLLVVSAPRVALISFVAGLALLLLARRARRRRPGRKRLFRR